MNRDAALAYAERCSAQFSATYCVYRLAAWPVGVYSVVKQERVQLPSEAEVTEFKPAGAKPGQGGLFE